MVNYKEILKLNEEGYSQRQIEASLHCSRHTICEVLTASNTHGIECPLGDFVTNEQIGAILFPNRHTAENLVPSI